MVYGSHVSHSPIRDVTKLAAHVGNTHEVRSGEFGIVKSSQSLQLPSCKILFLTGQLGFAQSLLSRFGIVNIGQMSHFPSAITTSSRPHTGSIQFPGSLSSLIENGIHLVHTPSFVINSLKAQSGLLHVILSACTTSKLGHDSQLNFSVTVSNASLIYVPS